MPDTHTIPFVVLSLTTALYPSHSPFLGTDPVFATKKSLICDLITETDPAKWKEMGWSEAEVSKRAKGGEKRVWVWRYNFVLASEAEVEAIKAKKAGN